MCPYSQKRKDLRKGHELDHAYNAKENWSQLLCTYASCFLHSTYVLPYKLLDYKNLVSIVFCAAKRRDVLNK